jgi:quercetin dioxygenase-like cupin family protein
MNALHGKSLDQPDETRNFGKGKLEVVQLGDVTVARGVFEPGWKWSEHIKPIAKTESCQVLHTGYIVSGRMGIRMDDGTEAEFGPGDAYVIPPGHEGWTVGDEPVVALEFRGAAVFAKPS